MISYVYNIKTKRNNRVEVRYINEDGTRECKYIERVLNEIETGGLCFANVGVRNGQLVGKTGSIARLTTSKSAVVVGYHYDNRRRMIYHVCNSVGEILWLDNNQLEQFMRENAVQNVNKSAIGILGLNWCIPRVG